MCLGRLRLFGADMISRRHFLGLAARQVNTYPKDFVKGTPVEYEDFLKILSDERYNVSPVVEYESSYRSDKVNVLLRHDMDNDNGYGMLELDYNHGFRSTSYLRLHAEMFYTIEEVTKFYQLLEKSWFEVGYHYEVVDLTMKRSEIDWVAAEALFEQELNLLRMSFNARSVTPHGGTADRPSRNSEFEADPSRLAKYGVFSALKIPFSKPIDFLYLSDTSHHFVTDGLDYFKDGLGRVKPGGVVEILVHPLVGRWNYREYPNEILPQLAARIFQIPTASVTLSSSSTSSTTVTPSVLTSASTLSSTSTSASLSSKAKASSSSALSIAWLYLIPPVALCTVGALAFYRIHERKQTRQRSSTLCTNCGHELLITNQAVCDKCGKPARV
jgi:hypothetical protein